MSRGPPLLEVNTSRRGEDNMEYHDDLTDFVPPIPHASPLSGGNTPGSDEGRMELIQELMETCTSLTKRVLALEEAKTTQDRRRLFKVRVETSTDKSLGDDASKQGRNDDKIEELNLTDGADIEVIVEDKGSGEKGGSTADQVSTARPEVSVASVPVNVSAATPSPPPTTTTIFSDEDLTIAKTLVKMRSEKAKEKEKGVVLIDEEEPPSLNRSTTTLQPLPTIDLKDKGKGVLVEEEPEKPEKVKRRDQGLAQIESDAELAQRLHEEELAELDRAQKEKQKQEEATNAALAEEFDEIQARMDDDHELAVILTHEKQEKYTIEERATLLAEYFERRKKQLAAKRAEAIRNKPPTRAQVRNRMITYLKHMENGSNTKKAGKRIKRITYSTSKQKSPKKSKVIKEQESVETNEEAAADYEQEKEELRMWLAVFPDEDEIVDPEILSVKYPIVDWESQNLGSVDMEDIHIYKIIRADGNTSYHKTFSSMLRRFDRQDLMDLHRLVMKRFEDNTPEVSAVSTNVSTASSVSTGIAHAAGRKGFTDPKTGIWLKWINRKIRIPIDLYPCQVKEKLTMKEVDGETIMKIETKMIVKDGTVSKFHGKFPGYTLSKERSRRASKKRDLQYDYMVYVERYMMVILLYWLMYRKWLHLDEAVLATRRTLILLLSFAHPSAPLQNHPSSNRLSIKVPHNVNNANANGGNGGNNGCMSLANFKVLLVEELCPRNKIEMLENKFWNHKMVGANHATYTDRFHELAKPVPHLVTLESSRIKRYIAGLAPKILGMHRVTQPTIIHNAILRAGILTGKAVSCGTLTKDNKKRKGLE
ncbi:hypothetical protein Tco_0874661 [Tanacetum coccineum]|uniref:Reverse transcriptase domain-containing protein n=1 Tax=Tanacetum coccineum TaxID=301880 RepID=A0ABQ5BM85_9ASTR